MRISDWSSDVCSSDLQETAGLGHALHPPAFGLSSEYGIFAAPRPPHPRKGCRRNRIRLIPGDDRPARAPRSTAEGNSRPQRPTGATRSEEHTSELQSLMRISYAVFCLKKKNTR